MGGVGKVAYIGSINLQRGFVLVFQVPAVKKVKVAYKPTQVAHQAGAYLGFLTERLGVFLLPSG